MIYRFVTKASVEERITQVCEKEHKDVLYLLVGTVLLISARSLSINQFFGFFLNIFALSIGGKEEDDANSFGCATWSRLQNGFHVQAGARRHPQVWNRRVVQG